MEISPSLKQILVVISTQLIAFSVGGCVVYPSVLLYQLKENDAEIYLDDNTASWIGSIQGLAGIPSIFMPMLMQWKGRKFGFVTACIFVIIGWNIAYFAKSTTAILISESFHGIGSVSVITISLMAISEIVDPLYRNTALRTYNMVQALGMAASGLFTIYVNWRTVAILMCTPAVISIIFVCIWPESPSWLAYKGEFDKCEETFFSVRGTDDRSVNELRELIKVHTTMKIKEQFTWRDVTDRVFYVPIFHMFVLLCLTYWSGSLVIFIYSIQIINEATGSVTYAIYGGIAIIFILFTCIVLNAFVLVKYFKNRTILFPGILGCIISLSINSVIYMFQYLKILEGSEIIFYSYLSFIICTSIGILPMTFDIAVELIPVKYRGIGGSLYIIFTSVLHTSSLKLFPYLLKKFNLWGIFLIYIVNAIVCGSILWKYLPETKGRTLQEIEDYYRFGNFNGNRHKDTVNTADSLIDGKLCATK